MFALLSDLVQQRKHSGIVQPFCQNLSLRTMPTGTLILKRSTEWSSYYPGRKEEQSFGPPQHQFCPCLRANADLWLLYFLCPFAPHLLRLLTLLSWFSGLCWPVATWLKELFTDSLGCEPHCCWTMGVEGAEVSTPRKKSELIVPQRKQSWGGVGPCLQGFASLPWLVSRSSGNFLSYKAFLIWRDNS